MGTITTHITVQQPPTLVPASKGEISVADILTASGVHAAGDADRYFHHHVHDPDGPPAVASHVDIRCGVTSAVIATCYFQAGMTPATDPAGRISGCARGFQPPIPAFAGDFHDATPATCWC
jgi:hypothetical protein